MKTFLEKKQSQKQAMPANNSEKFSIWIIAKKIPTQLEPTL